MRYIFTTVALCAITSLSSAQVAVSTITGSASSLASSSASIPALTNVAKAKDALMSRLTPALALTAVEKPGVASLLTTFLSGKSKILPLLNGAKADYYNKLAGLQTDLFGNLKTVLTAAQYSKLLSLKPGNPSRANVISALYY